MSNFENRQYDQLLSKVRGMLGLRIPETHQDVIITTEVSSVVHSKPDQQLEGTFGKPDSYTTDYEIETKKLRALQDRCRAASKRIENSMEAERIGIDSSSKQRTKRGGENKENSRQAENSSLYLSAYDDLGSGIKPIEGFNHGSVSQTVEVRALKNELERSKDKELQLRMEVERLTKELTKMHQEKEALCRQFERRCQQLSECRDKQPIVSKFDSDLVISLNAELRQAKFVIQQLKLQATRQEYLNNGFNQLSGKYLQLEQKITYLLQDKFRLQDKIQFQERALNQNVIRSTLFASDSRIKTLRQSLEFWIKKSRKIEQEAHKIIGSLRSQCDQLRKDLLVQNKQAQKELRRFMRRFQGNVHESSSTKEGRPSLSKTSAPKSRNRSVSGTSHKPNPPRAIRYR